MILGRVKTSVTVGGYRIVLLVGSDHASDDLRLAIYTVVLTLLVPKYVLQADCNRHKRLTIGLHDINKIDQCCNVAAW